MNKMKLKDFPLSEQPYEKLCRLGAAYLSDAELLAIIIKTGSNRATAIDIAFSLLENNQQSLLNLFDYELDTLQKIHGIGRVKAIQLKAVAELAVRLSKAKAQQGICLSDSSSLADFYMEQLRHEKEENLRIAYFDGKCCFLGDELIAIGGSNFAHFYPRDIFRRAIEKNAVYFVLIHNHPSGDPSPSQDDMAITKRIKEGGQIIGISLEDHLIIGDLNYFSFRMNELL